MPETKNAKKILSLLLALMLCLSLFPAALAEEPGEIAPADEGQLSPAENEAELSSERTGWAVPLQEPPAADEPNVTEHTIDVPDVDPETLTEEGVYSAMLAMKADFPEGMPWTNDDFYRWNGGIYSGGYGCAGFAFLLSDAAFGKLPATMKKVNYDRLHVGDVLRVNNDTHSVIVLEVCADHVVIAEGNYNSSIHWGRTLTRSQVEASDHVLTRWPGEALDLESCSISLQILPELLHYDEDFSLVATVLDENGDPAMGVRVYFSILDEQGDFVRTWPLNGYTYSGRMTDNEGQAVYDYAFRKADGRIEPGKYLAFVKLDDTSKSATAPFTLLGDELPGDVNGDGQVSVKDLIRLRRHLAGSQVELSTGNADLNGDGAVDVLDLARLRKLLTGAAD